MTTALNLLESRLKISKKLTTMPVNSVRKEETPCFK